MSDCGPGREQAAQDLSGIRKVPKAYRYYDNVCCHILGDRREDMAAIIMFGTEREYIFSKKKKKLYHCDRVYI